MANEFSTFVRRLSRCGVDILRHGAIGRHVGACRPHRSAGPDAHRTDPNTYPQTRAQCCSARFAVKRFMHFASALSHELPGSFAFEDLVTDHAALDHAAIERSGGMEVRTNRSGL